MRVKLASRGSGRWQSSGGFRSKFGLTVTEIMRGLEELKAHGMQDCLKLLHFHLGSQITNIRIVKGALNEAARVYTELAKLGAGLRYIDVGGGLGVDYDGSQTNFESSMNYTLQEYANDVVYHIQTVCDEAGVPHPTIVSESGRAVVAYHSVLVFNVLGVSGFRDENVPTTANPDWEQPLLDLVETYNNVNARNALEAFHDAQQSLDMALSLFTGGYLPLEQRSLAENLFWAIATKLQRIAQSMPEVPEDLQNLDEQLSDTYFCNFSLFQSIPDSWAVKQLFPVMPIHRLNEKPMSHAVLGDITCDSDGKLDRFVDRRDVKKTLPLHSVNGDAYYLGIFLVGAYQEILGDLHNLFGDTHAVHVSLDEQRRGAPRHADQGRHRARSAGLRGVRRRGAARQAADRRRNGRARRPRGLRGSGAVYCASTRTGCTGIRTWRGRPSKSQFTIHNSRPGRAGSRRAGTSHRNAVVRS